MKHIEKCQKYVNESNWGPGCKGGGGGLLRDAPAVAADSSRAAVRLRLRLRLRLSLWQSGSSPRPCQSPRNVERVPWLPACASRLPEMPSRRGRTRRRLGGQQAWGCRVMNKGLARPRRQRWCHEGSDREGTEGRLRRQQRCGGKKLWLRAGRGPASLSTEASQPSVTSRKQPPQALWTRPRVAEMRSLGKFWH